MELFHDQRVQLVVGVDFKEAEQLLQLIRLVLEFINRHRFVLALIQALVVYVAKFIKDLNDNWRGVLKIGKFLELLHLVLSA